MIGSMLALKPQILLDKHTRITYIIGSESVLVGYYSEFGWGPYSDAKHYASIDNATKDIVELTKAWRVFSPAQSLKFQIYTVESTITELSS